MKWTGVIPAITTGFNEAYQVDHAFMAEHARWLITNGCTGVVALGSLGEGATLTYAEKIDILKNLAAALRGRAPVVAAISVLGTEEAVALAKTAEGAGCAGLMILPPYVYKGDWRERTCRPCDSHQRPKTLSAGGRLFSALRFRNFPGWSPCAASLGESRSLHRLAGCWQSPV